VKGRFHYGVVSLSSKNKVAEGAAGMYLTKKIITSNFIFNSVENLSSEIVPLSSFNRQLFNKLGPHTELLQTRILFSAVHNAIHSHRIRIPATDSVIEIRKYIQ